MNVIHYASLYMEMSNMKNMVILKNLPSNIVDEAIVILKGNLKVKKLQYSKNENICKNEKMSNEKDEDYIIKEAESVISDYIAKIENQNLRGKKEIKEIEKKYQKAKKINIGLAVMLAITSICLIF